MALVSDKEGYYIKVIITIHLYKACPDAQSSEGKRGGETLY
jgi:hypothetical protein